MDTSGFLLMFKHGTIGEIWVIGEIGEEAGILENLEECRGN